MTVEIDSGRRPGAVACACLAASALTLLLCLGTVSAQDAINTATVTAPSGITDSNPGNDSATDTDALLVPALTVSKSGVLDADVVAPAGVANVGDQINYTITVENTGTGPASGVSVSDPLLGALSCQIGGSATALPATLPASQSLVCTGTHTLDQADIDAGSVDNTATATADQVCRAGLDPVCSATENTVVPQVQALTLAKAAAVLDNDLNGDGFVNAGDTLEYTVTATNTGNVDLTDVVVSDAQLTPGSITCATLPAGGTCILTGTHVVTAAEAQAGEVVNTASVTSTEVPGPTDSNTVTTPVVQVPALTLVKSAATLDTDADASGDITEGDTLSYTVTLTNTGDVALTNVVVSDPQLTPGSTTCASVAVGGTCVLSGTHVVTAGEAQAGEVVNTANATSTEVPGPTDSNTVTTPVVQVPALTLAKSAATLTTDADASGDITEGDTLSYTITLTNTGDVALTNVVVSDPQLTPGSTTCASVAVGGTCVLSGTHVVSATEAQAGEVVNTANATSTEIPGPTDSNTVTTPVVQVPALTLAKSAATLTTDADGSGGITEGDTLSYTVTLTNTGDVALTNVIVSDPQLTPGSTTCASVAIGGTCVLSGTHVVTAAEAQAGEVVNTASATSTEVPGPTDSNTVTTPVVQVPALTLSKSAATLATDADASGDITEGDTLSYTVTLTNTGDVALTNVVVSDPQLTPGSTTCASVAVGGTCVLSGTHVVTAGEAQAGQVVNTANATSTEIPGPTDSNTVTTPVVQVPALTLAKSAATLTTDADASGDITEGDTLSYTVTLTNTGDVALTNVEINDAQLTPASATCASVAIGGTCVLSGSHVVSAAEAQAGEVVNTANATSTEVPGPTDSNTVTTPVVQVPALTLAKSTATLTTDADASGDITEGDTLSYTVTLTNTGDVALTNVIVGDPQLTPGSTTCASVAVGGTCVLSGTHVVTAGEAQAGEVVNTANATSTEVPGPTDSNTVTTPVVQVPALTLSKSAATLTTDADASGDITEGDTLGYTVTLTNTGDVALTNVIVSDPQLTPGSTTCASVPVGGTCVLSGTHVVTASEAQAGEVVNTANATSTEIPGPTDSNTVTTPVVQVPALTLSKSAATLATDADGSGDITEGDTLSYTVTLTNTGDVALTNVVVSDPLLTPASTTCASVAIGGTCVLSGTHVVSAAEAQAGEVVNTANASSTEIPGPTDSNTVTTPVVQVPALTLVKSTATLATDADASGDITEGDTLSYTVTLTNTGDTALTNVIVSDPQLTPGSITCASVAVGGTCVLSGTHVVTAGEAQAGEVVNTASATSTEVPGPTASNTVTTPVVQVPALTLAKSAATLTTDADASGDITEGDTLSYTVTLTNTGDVVLTNVVVSDPQLTPGSTTCASIAIGGTCVLSGTHVISAAEAQAGEVVNTANATSTEVPGPTNSNTVTTPVVQVPALTLSKSTATLTTDADASGDITEGDTLSYTVTLTNTGDVVLTNVVVSDPQLTPGSTTCASVAIGGTCVLSGTHVVTAGEAQAGEVVNTASATSTEVPGPTASNTITTPVVQVPALTLSKSAATLTTDADASGDITEGDTLGYTVTLTNTGDTALTNVVVSDPLLTPGSTTCASVAVGGTCVLSGTHVVTAAEAQAGEVINTANATSTEVPGPTSSNTVTTPVSQVPEFSLVKSAASLATDADASGDVTEGDTLGYTVTLTNTGDTALTNVIVSDPLLTPGSTTCASVAVGGACVLSGTHVVTAAEAQAGQVVNTASATSTEVPGPTDSNTVTTPVVQLPALTLAKSAATLTTDADASGDITEGDTLSYTVTLTNTGDLALTNVIVSDPQLTPGSTTCASVAVGGTCVLSGTHVVTAGEAQAGQVVNTASATSTEIPGPTDSNTVTTPVVQVPALTLAKSTATLTTDADASGDITEGDTLGYTITLTNTGDVALTNVVISDPQLTPGSTTCANVAIGGTCVLSGTHVVTAAEAQAGQVVNTANATSTEVPGPTDSNTVTTTVVQVPALTLAKSTATLTTDADASGDITEGDTLSYTVTLTNTGDIALTNVIVSDPQLTPGSTTCANVAIGGTCVLSGTHVVTAGEAQAGQVVNTADATSTEIPGPTGSNTVTTPVIQVPSLTLDKSAATLTTDADASGDITEGDTLSYTVTLTNTGDVVLTNVVVSDPQLTPGSTTCASVAIGGTCVLSGSHVVTTAEAQAGQVVNTANATSTEVPGPTDSNTVTTPVVQVPALTLAKSTATLTTDADASGDITEGDTLSYTITLTNTGDVALTNVVVSDPQLTPGSTTCASVAIGDTCVLSGTHVVTASEAQAGQVVNTANATSTEVPGPTDSNTVTTPVVQVPALTLAKSTATLTTDADASGDITEGDTLSYTVTLTNTGDVALSNVIVNDPQLTPGSTTCASVAVGGTCVLTGTHVVTAAEAQAGQVVNTASATSTEVPGPTDSNTVTTPVVQLPALTLSKSAATLTTDADASGGITEGDTLSYTVTLTNTGDIALTNVVVSDPLLTPGSTTCASVAIGGTCVLSGTHVVTAGEAQAGQVVNTASATSTEVPGPTASNTVTTPVVQVPALTLSKSAATLTTDADASGDITEGDTLSYTITLTNVGDIPLTNVVVSDPQLTPGSTTCASVAVGGTCVLSGTHVVTASEAQAGQVVNTANATSTEIPGPTASNTVTTPVVQVPALTLAKSTATLTTDADASGDITEGDTLSYTVTLTNTGDTALTNVVVSDPQLTPGSTTCASVAVGGTCVLTGTHVVTAGEAQAGQVVNTANATSTEVPGPTDSNTVTTPVVQVPALTLSKSAATLATDADASGGITEGDTLGYTITLTNTGDVALTNVVVNDPQLTPGNITCASVAVGGTCVLSGTHVVTAAEAQAGEVINTANATSTEVPGPTDSNTVTTSVIQVPALTILKSAATLTTDADASGDITEGDTLGYTVTLTNTGDLALTNVVVNDPQLTPGSTTCANVVIGGTCVLSGTHVVTAGEAQAGQVVNTANATSTEVPGPTDSNTVTTPVVQVPALTLAKSAATLTTDADASGDITEGDTLSYTITLTNTGDIALTNVIVSDPQLSPGSTTCANVAIGGTCVLSGTHVVTAGEAQAGEVVNTASATSTEVPGPTDSNTVTTPVVQVPALTLDKSPATLVTDADASGDITEGDTLGYTVTLTNTGDLPLTNVVISDPQLTPGSTTCASVAVGGTCVLSGTHVVSNAEALAGQVVNIASATSTEVPGPTNSNTVTTPVRPVPGFTLFKSDATLAVDADGSGSLTGGDTLGYTVTLTNTGNLPLTNVVVSDPKLTPGSTSCASVPLGGTCVLTGTHVVTDAEVRARRVVNTATATSVEIPAPVPSNTVTTPVANRRPVAITDTYTTPAGVPVALFPLNADSDPDGDTLYVFSINGVPLTPGAYQEIPVTGGTVIVAADGSFSFVPDPGFTGTVTFPYAITDRNGGIASANQIINVISPDVAEATLAKSPATLLVDADGSGDVSLGDTLAYTITLTNTGTVELTDVVVTDALIDPGSITCAVVAVADTCVLEGTHVVTQAEAQAGEVVNTANATTGQTPGPVDSNTVVTPVAPVPAGVPAMTTTKPEPVLATDADGDGLVSAGDTLAYTVTVTNTGETPLTEVRIDDAMLTPDSVTCALVLVGDTCVLEGTYVVTMADVEAGALTNTATASSAQVCLPGETPAAGCTASVGIDIEQRPQIAIEKLAVLTTDEGVQGRGEAGDVITYSVIVTNTGNLTISDLVVEDSFQGGAPVLLDCTPTTLAPGEVATCASYTHTITAAEANAGIPLENAVIATGTTKAGTQTITVTGNAAAVVEVQADPTVIRLSKSAQPTEVRVGDLVRYQVRVENTGGGPLVDGLLVDTPPAGFTYVQDSLVVADDDGAGRLVGTFPIRVDRIDVAPGQSATISYLLRVGAGVRPGVHVNSAVLTSDGSQSNVATAQVRLVGDPMLEDSLVLGTVFDDRDGDGRQDLAALSGVRLQGGFDAAAYVAGSTVIHREGKSAPVADASAPLLRGLDVGDIAGRQSEADPASVRQVVVSQRLAEPRFTDDFVLSNDQGLSLRMDAAGNTRLEGEPAQNTAAMPRVERRVSREADGYRVDYVVSNVGIQERGIPGVRIASVEGLLVETDPFGRYHLVGVAGGPWERGRNFILKVDTATLPPGSVATTRNPLVRRVTQGIPTRFDFGFTLPGGLVAGAEEVLEIELGNVMFPPASAELRPGHEPVIAGIAGQLQERDAGELVITAQGGDEALAFRRARVVQQAVEAAMPGGLGEVVVSLRADAADPDSRLATVGKSPVLGTVLFDTGQAAIAPRYDALLDAVAADIGQRAADAEGALAVGIVGHADRRGSDQANTALGLRRARAVFDALASRLPPELRQRLRVDISQDPDASVRNTEGGE